MSTLRNNRELAALNKENYEELPRRNVAQNSNVSRSQEDYITQVSDEIEGGFTKKLSQEFSRTENCILGVLARLDDFLKNPLIQGYSGTVPETSRNAFGKSQATNEDDAQSDPHPEARIFHNQTTQNSGPEDGHDMVTGVQRESLCGHDMVTGATEQIPSRHDMKQEFRKIVSATTTWWQEFRRKSHNVLPVHLQESRKRNHPPVNRNSEVKTPLQRSNQIKFCWPFINGQITTILQTFILTSTEFRNYQRH